MTRSREKLEKWGKALDAELLCELSAWRHGGARCAGGLRCASCPTLWDFPVLTTW